ncbi:MAG: hypothetical protein IPI57_14520 [Candidatus Competibacteraceae bacterium]|nr:hypothetical protein [Candidatus Competibacteraceae bacterium]
MLLTFQEDLNGKKARRDQTDPTKISHVGSLVFSIGGDATAHAMLTLS